MSSRIQKWDILKFLLMFCVVLGHFADYHVAESEEMKSLFLFIYSFHMPLFIFVSGLFSKRMINERRWDKILGYLVLYFFTKIMVFAYDGIFKQSFEFRLFGETGLAWFMFALFAFGLITVGTSRFKPAYVFVFSLLLSLFAGYDNTVDSELVLSRIIVFYPFYYAGYCIDPKKLEEMSRGWWKKLLALAAMVVLGWVAFNVNGVYHVRPMFTGQHPYDTLGGGEDWGGLIRLACYAVSALACLCIIVIIPDRLDKKGRLARLGQYTLSVYVFHYIILKLLYNTFDMREYLAEGDMVWYIVPMALATTLLFSNKWFNMLVTKVSAIPTSARKKKETQVDLLKNKEEIINNKL